MMTAAHLDNLSTIQLTVNNHPGVMSHVCGLFARRSYNLEGILVTPEQDGKTCSMWLLVNEDARLKQIAAQVHKLHDVLTVSLGKADGGTFERLAACMDVEGKQA